MSDNRDPLSPDLDPAFALERAVSLAVVKADHAPAVEAVIAAVNIAAAAIGLVNPNAGFAVSTVSVLGGWVWNTWKFNRVKAVLEELQKRIQAAEGEYVHQEEFADLLGDALRRIGDQPEQKRREWLGSILLKVIDEPKDHTDNRLLLRLVDELGSSAHRLLREMVGMTAALHSLHGQLAAAAGIPRDEIEEILNELRRNGLILDELHSRGREYREDIHDFPDWLTNQGREFLKFCSA